MSRGATGGVSVRAGASPELRSRRVRARPIRPRDPGDEPLHATGALLCAECGRLHWRETMAPHRASMDTVSDPPCPHCNAHAWLDLRRESTALAVRLGEDGDAEAPSPTMELVRNASMGMLVGAFVGVLATSSLLTGGLVAGLAGAVAALSTARLRRAALPPRPALPERWAYALPAEAPSSTLLRGHAHPVEPLRSPITGRPCAGYEVGLRRDDDDAGPLTSWALLEQRVAPLELDGTSLDPSTVHLDLPRESLGVLSSDEADPAAIEWFRERGCSLVGGTMVVYETILPLGAAVQVTSSAQGSTLRVGPRALPPAP